MQDHPAVAARLSAKIENGDYRAGQRLPGERVLAAELGVARGTLRRALSELVELGMVQRRGGSGTFVCHRPPTDAERLLDEVRPLALIDARRAVEPHVCRRAVLRARDSDLVRMESYLSQMDQLTTRPEEFGVLDREFHLALAELSGNPMLVWFTRQLAEVRLHEQWHRVLRLSLSEQQIRRYNTEHRAIMAAIRQRDAERAAKLMQTHLDSARSSLLALAEG